MSRRVVSMVVVIAAACGTASHDPRLTAIEPAVVTSLTETPGVVRGAELDTRAKVDLNGTGSAQIDRGWRVRVDDVDVAALWVDPQTIDVTIPRGLAVGAHDVTATSPDRRHLVLPQAL